MKDAFIWIWVAGTIFAGFIQGASHGELKFSPLETVAVVATWPVYLVAPFVESISPKKDSK